MFIFIFIFAGQGDIGDNFSSAAAVVAEFSSMLIRRVLNFCHRSTGRLREVEEGEEECSKEHRAKRDKAVGSHGTLHVGPPDANHEVRRPVDLTSHGHGRRHIPENEDKEHKIN